MGTSPPDRVLLDTNTYLRLGRRLAPLFKKTWGAAPGLEFCLHRDAKTEYFRNPGLRTKFDWVQDEPWLTDLHNGKVKLGTKHKAEVSELLEYLDDATQTMELGCSLPDRKCLATALVLKVPLATDDVDLQKLCAEFSVEALSSLQVLHRLLIRTGITLVQVRQSVLQWQADGDFRTRFWEEYPRLFGEPTPRLGP